MNSIQIIHHDEHILIVDKPAGLLAVPGRGADKQDCLITRLQIPFPDALAVHRLDQVTSGLMIFARDARTQTALSRQFAKRVVSKRYVALVEGLMSDEMGEVDAPMIVDWPHRPLQKIDFLQGKPALTRWRVIARDVEKRITRLELEPITGRTHQLRLHLAHIGHPIVGDVLYGAAHAERVYLHATELHLNHPQSDMQRHFSATAMF